MSALKDAARQVDQAWCKTELREPGDNGGDGDRYCAVGALMNSLLLSNGVYLDWTLPAVGTAEELYLIHKHRESLMDDDGTIDEFDEMFATSTAHHTIYNYINDSQEGKVLAEVILENYPDRFIYEDEYWSFEDEVNYTTEIDLGRQWFDEEDWSKIIWNFNDHDDTTREEVIAMMEKADLRMDEQAAFEDAAEDELVEEVKELVSA